jgi:hypothetical protein
MGLEGELAAEAATEAFLDHELARMKERLRRLSQEPRSWREAGILSGVTTALTADELREVSRALNEIAQRYVARVKDRSLIPPGAREVRILVATSVAPPSKGATR